MIKATVIGAGSVGLGLAASLAIAGQNVVLMTREGSVAALRGAAITVNGLHGEHHVPPGAVEVQDAALPTAAARACDMLVVTTKTYQIAEALAPFAGAPAPAGVLSMHNGIGASEAIRAVLGPGVPVYAASMMLGLARQGLSHVEVTAAASPIMTGPILGDDPAPLTRFVDAAQGGFLPIQVDPRMRDTVLFKLLFNTCMNPTGGLTGQTYGALLADADMRALIERLADETLAVLDAAYGYRPAVSGPAYVAETVARVVARSQGHRSSMLQDITAGRRTEIDALNGAVARLGREAKVPTPTHDALVALIRGRTAG